MAVSDYVSRTIDVLAFRGGVASTEVLLGQSLADTVSGGEITTGIQKLAQRWLITLLTELGTVKYKPTMGTTFMTQLRQGYIRSDADMRALFALSELRVREQLNNEVTATTPLDEQYRDASLTGVTVIPGYVNISVTFRSRAADGTSTFIVPIPLVV